MLTYIFFGLGLSTVASMWLQFVFNRTWTALFYGISLNAYLLFGPYLFYTLVNDLGDEFNMIQNVLMQIIQHIGKQS